MRENSISILLVLLLAFLLVILIGIGILFITKKLKRFSRTAFGTDTLAEGIQKQKRELSETPRSLQAMTSVYLPQIQKDFPEFNLLQYRQEAEVLLRNFLLSVAQKNTGLLLGCSKKIQEQADALIADLNVRQMTRHFDEIVLHKTEISRYIRKEASSAILFQTAVSYFDYTMDASGEIVLGDPDTKKQTVYEIELVYIQDAEKVEESTEGMLGMHCPNCGAAVTQLGNKNCTYCGSALKEVNIYAWQFNKIEEQTVLKKQF